MLWPKVEAKFWVAVEPLVVGAEAVWLEELISRNFFKFSALKESLGAAWALL